MDRPHGAPVESPRTAACAHVPLHHALHLAPFASPVGARNKRAAARPRALDTQVNYKQVELLLYQTTKSEYNVPSGRSTHDRPLA